MPRKRKKSTQQRKPSLVFTESPVNIQTRVPTPVLCARHPPTAQTVSVNELQDMTWVSPQFRKTLADDRQGGKRRITRQRRQSIASSLRTTASTNKENTQWEGLRTAGNRKSKFKSLKFIGDQTTVASLSEEVNISCDTETTEDEGGGVQNKISDLETSCDDLDTGRSRTNLRLGKNGNQIVLNEVSNENGIPHHIRTRNLQLNSSLHNDLECKRSRSSSCSVASETRNESNRESTHVQININILTEGNCVDEQLGEHCNTNKRKNMRHKKMSRMKNVQKSRFNLSALSTDSDSPDELKNGQHSLESLQNNHHLLDDDYPEGTQKRHSPSLKSPVKRLFEKQQETVSPCLPQPREIISATEESDSSNLPSNSSISHIGNTKDRKGGTPLRRSSRIAANLRHLVTGGTPVRNSFKMMNVLVPDTPDSEKGLTKRQKQLKGILKDPLIL